MPLNYIDFLVSAIDNFNFNNEIGYRNAISRVYYSTYHKSLSQLIKMPTACSSHHATIIRYLASKECSQNEQHGKNTLKELSLSMKQLRNARNKSDYRLDTTISKAAAIANMDLAHRIFDLWGDPQKQFKAQ
ncbi:hypothetical protein [Sodalis sp.]|uniref:hypothetical protein n=1 Tax=Sodalis sp. (in: enterobacteria) TaxID=1898979 RepID=UPI003872F96F